MSIAFSKFGVEIETMIVDQDTLDPRPLADQLLRDAEGQIENSRTHGSITWSNELVMHVVEFKTTVPALSLDGLSQQFHAAMREADRRLQPLGCRLLGTGMHPWYHPERDGVQRWSHDDREIYEAFDRIFDCRGHGWSNLQSFHLNLPFDPDDDDGFRRLHSAIRLVLPLVPVLAASTPVKEGALTGLLDTRLETYRHNCDRIPSLTAGVIPDIYRTRAEYEERVFGAIERDLRPHDPNGLLEPVWTNARGAIVRFDRGSIEIRVGDCQECPAQDLTILQFIVHLVRAWHDGGLAEIEAQEDVSTESLRLLFLDVLRVGGNAFIEDPAMLKALQADRPTTASAALLKLLPAKASWSAAVGEIIEHGNLAQRIRKRLAGKADPDHLKQLYGALADCLRSNRSLTA